MTKKTIVRFQKLWRLFEKNATFPIIVAFISKMAYFKNGLFKKLAYLKTLPKGFLIGARCIIYSIFIGIQKRYTICIEINGGLLRSGTVRGLW